MAPSVRSRDPAECPRARSPTRCSTARQPEPRLAGTRSSRSPLSGSTRTGIETARFAPTGCPSTLDFSSGHGGGNGSETRTLDRRHPSVRSPSETRATSSTSLAFVAQAIFRDLGMLQHAFACVAIRSRFVHQRAPKRADRIVSASAFTRASAGACSNAAEVPAISDFAKPPHQVSHGTKVDEDMTLRGSGFGLSSTHAAVVFTQINDFAYQSMPLTTDAPPPAAALSPPRAGECAARNRTEGHQEGEPTRPEDLSRSEPRGDRELLRELEHYESSDEDIP